MKSLSLFTTGKSLARHDDRGRRALRTFPRTDYHFQALAEDVVTARAEQTVATAAELHSFRKMSSEFLSEETPRNYLFEMGLLALVVVGIVWPIVYMMIAVA